MRCLPWGFTVQMSDPAGTIRGDHSTEQGDPTLFITVAQERLSGGGADRTIGGKRVGMSQARGSEEHSLKTCPNNGECAGKGHKGTASTLSWPASLHFHSVLGGTPKGISWHLFVYQPLPRGCPAQNAISCPLFGFYSSISLSIGSYPLFKGECFWDLGVGVGGVAISSQHTACWPHSHPSGPQGGRWAVRVHVTLQQLRNGLALSL